MENAEDAGSENIMTVIRQYESVIETLTTQVEFYANEQENLRKEISILIKENKALAHTVNELLDSQSNIKNETEQKQIESELVDNLKNQLNLILKEKDAAVQLWQNALRNIDHLEEELKLFEGRAHGYFSKSEVAKLKQKYENQIADLEEQLVRCHSKLDDILKDSTRKLENKHADLETALENQQSTFKLANRLETEVQQLQGKLKEIIAIRDELQNNVDKKNNFIEELKIKQVQAKAKVTEAIQIVEAAFYEKDAALRRENEAKEEVVKISKTLSEIIDEATEKVKTEIENVRQDYRTRLKQTHQDMEKQKEELTAKNIQLEKYTRECKLLEEELERMRKGNLHIDESNTSKMLILEKNLESTFQSLLLSERKNLQVAAEKESIKADLEQMAEYYKNDIKTREIEKQVLMHEIQTRKKQLKMSNSSLIQTAGEMEKLNSKIKLIDIEIRDKLRAKDMMYDQVLTKTIENYQSKNTTIQNELQTQLDMHVALNRRWRKEMQVIIDKLENQMKKMKAVNKSLRLKLKKTVNESMHYRKSLEDICGDVKKISSATAKDINIK